MGDISVGTEVNGKFVGVSINGGGAAAAGAGVGAGAAAGTAVADSNKRKARSFEEIELNMHIKLSTKIDYNERDPLTGEYKYPRLAAAMDDGNGVGDITSVSGPKAGGGAGGNVRGNFPSINQLQEIVKKGQAPKEIIRFDKPNPPGDPSAHVHLRGGVAMRQDGTMKHSGSMPSKTVIRWLKEMGFLQ